MDLCSLLEILSLILVVFALLLLLHHQIMIFLSRSLGGGPLLYSLDLLLGAQLYRTPLYLISLKIFLLICNPLYSLLALLYTIYIYIYNIQRQNVWLMLALLHLPYFLNNCEYIHKNPVGDCSGERGG